MRIFVAFLALALAAAVCGYEVALVARERERIRVLEERVSTMSARISSLEGWRAAEMRANEAYVEEH